MGVSGGQVASEEASAEQRAASAVAALREHLGETLRAAVQKDPRTAVRVCRLEAPQIAGRLAVHGVRVGRTSQRLRNPANAPARWLLPFLEEWGSGPARPGESRTLDLGGGRLGYVEPIYLKPLCTVCHGTAIEPSLARFIDDLYPEDQAVGFAVGDFRGLFWATVDTAPTAP